MSILDRSRLYKDTRLTIDGCIERTKGLNPKGYGQIWYDGRLVQAHRLSWELDNGPIPKGIKVLHHCDNPPCINVSHLFLGTQRDNMKDMQSKGRHRNSIKSECFRGHDYTDSNTRITADGRRVCRECDRINHAEWRANR